MDRISLDSITVRPGRRRLSPEVVQSLAASISEIGLLNAITVTSDGVLVAGLHRLEAARSLGWRDVPATVITVDEATRELAEIDENLCRSDLTELERGELEKRRTELRIAAHPETKHGGSPGAGRGKGKRARKDDKMSSFQTDPAEGKKAAAEARAAQRRRRRAERIAPDVKDEIVDMLEIADSGVELDALARMEPAQQRAAVAAVKAGTARDVRHAKELAEKPHVAHATGKDQWYTPADIVEAARAVLGGIDLDPASNEQANAVVKASAFYTAEQDGLAKHWSGRVWMNPPYSAALVRAFAEKLAAHVEAGDVSAAVVLVNNATDTQWFARLASVASWLCFPTGRVRFWGPDGAKGAPLQGQALVYFGSDGPEFARHFASLGILCEVHHAR